VCLLVDCSWLEGALTCHGNRLLVQRLAQR
jgi:hypothetical protein